LAHVRNFLRSGRFFYLADSSDMASHKPPVRFGLGGVPLSNEFGVITEKDAYATLEAAWNAGVLIVGREVVCETISSASTPSRCRLSSTDRTTPSAV
jgi:hypothetical protein